MEKVVRVFNSHEESERADREFYRSLTPKERVEIALQLIDDTYGTEHRLEPVVKIIKLERFRGTSKE